MSDGVNIGNRVVDSDHPVFMIAEIGINHNGDLDIAKRLIDTAVVAGCDAVKFQKRTPELCVPEEQQEIPRETPWGVMSYLEYRRRMEFGEAEYTGIDCYCRERGVLWFASCWDEPSVGFIERFEPPCHKVASACLTDLALLARIATTGRPVIVSTGMSTINEIREAASLFEQDQLAQGSSCGQCLRAEEFANELLPGT